MKKAAVRLVVSCMGLVMAGFIRPAPAQDVDPAINFDNAVDRAEQEFTQLPPFLINAEGSDLELARQQALAEGKQQALATMLARIVPREERQSVIETVTSGIHPEELEKLITSFSLQQEIFGRSRYQAQMFVSLSFSELSRYLIAQKLPFSPIIAPLAVIVPYALYDSVPSLWEERDPWLLQFYMLTDEEKLRMPLSFVLPDSDARDYRTLSLNDLGTVNRSSFLQFMGNYFSASLIFARIRVQQDTLAGIKLFFFGVFRDVFGSTMQVPLPLANMSLAPSQRDTHLRAARDAVLSALHDEWLARTVIDPERRITMPLIVFGGDIDGVAQTEARIKRLQSVQKSEALRYRDARVDYMIEFAGSMDQHVALLAAAGIPVAIERLHGQNLADIRELARGRFRLDNRAFVKQAAE